MLRLTFSETTSIVFMSAAMICGFFSIAALIWWLSFLNLLFSDLDEEDKELQGWFKSISVLSVLFVIVAMSFSPGDPTLISKILSQ